MPIAYLIESTYIDAKFQLKGKTLRAYEVNAEYKQAPNGHNTYMRWYLKPTGYIYSVKDGKIVKSRTKATLNNKYVSGYYSKEILTSIKPDQPWASALYSTPELALGAKHIYMQQNLIKAQATLTEYQTALNTTSSQTPDASFILQEYPELFI
jgi:hypothetical protein